ncbi:MAG TPA: hypothetical protein VGC08_08030 [Pedobacter sp.]
MEGLDFALTKTFDTVSSATGPGGSGTRQPKPAILIFINGYRMAMPVANIIREFKRTDEVTTFDINDYWNDIDDQFKTRLNDQFSFYADGDAPTLTAKNHMGFEARKLHGKRAAQSLMRQITAIKNLPKETASLNRTRFGTNAALKNYDPKKIPIDIVCHSMGYAYALGMIEELIASGFWVDRLYAIAPENPTSGYTPGFLEVANQYGSGVSDPWYQQDRIAPQGKIPGIKERAFIPQGVEKGPYDSHSIANYGWIFKIKQYQQGYISPR